MIFRDIAFMLSMSIGKCFDWLSVLFDKTEMLSVFLSMFIIAMVYRFLLAPLMGAAIRSGASDTVKAAKKASKEDKKK